MILLLFLLPCVGLSVAALVTYVEQVIKYLKGGERQKRKDALLMCRTCISECRQPCNAITS